MRKGKSWIAVARLAGCLAVALFLSAVSSYGQNNRISGQVMSPDRRPIERVFVELVNEVNRIIGRQETNGAGVFMFNNLGTGRFIVRVMPYGTDYERTEQEVQIANLSLRVGGGSTSEDITIYLTKKKKDADSATSTGVIFAQDVPVGAKKAYEKALADFSSNKTPEAVAELEKALQEFPTYYEALERLAKERLVEAKYADAGALFERAATVDERSANAWYGLSYCAYVLDDAGKSVTAAQKAAVINPSSADIALLLGIAQRKNRQYQEAEKTLLRANKLANERSADAYWNLALLYAYNLRNYRLAADALEGYIRVKPDHPNISQIRKLIQEYRQKEGA